MMRCAIARETVHVCNWRYWCGTFWQYLVVLRETFEEVPAKILVVMLLLIVLVVVVIIVYAIILVMGMSFTYITSFIGVIKHLSLLLWSMLVQQKNVGISIDGAFVWISFAAVSKLGHSRSIHDAPVHSAIRGYRQCWKCEWKVFALYRCICSMTASQRSRVGIGMNLPESEV